MDKIEEVKKLLWILDSKHNVSVSKTKENIDYIADEIVKLFCQPAVMPRFSKQDVIDCLKQRDKEAFDNPYQKYEHREINQAIDIIIRLMPPSSFPNGA